MSLTKPEARVLAYRALHDSHAARFPFPIEGRIPNFRGAEAAARRLRDLDVYRRARAIKCNPDSPQLPLRAMAMEDGKTLFLPTPRLRAPFVRIDPRDVPAGKARTAAQIGSWRHYGREVAPREVAVDLVVCGSVAVAEDGSRAGKGAGYSDLEYALLRELGHPEVPVVTTVHPAQFVGAIATEPHDISLDWILTPGSALETRTPHRKPSGIEWDHLPPAALEEMPVLREVSWLARSVPDVLAPGLRLVFVGINPGHASATAGHHFAGPNNHFWRLLHEGGLTPRRFAPSEDGELPALGVGVTNIVRRSSRGEQDLSWDELQAGGADLRRRIATWRPSVVALLGKQVYRAYARLPRSASVSWGLQDRQTVSGVHEFTAPNPSSRSTVPYEARLALFREMARLALPQP